ncbi:MAG: hypothetical protein ABI954_04340, partial [Pyrinomonadaceae bacterium]
MIKLKTFVLIAILLLLAIGVEAQTKQAKTARDFFMLVPSEFYTFQCCSDNKKEYLKQYVSSENINFLEGTDEGVNEFTLAVYGRPNGTYLIGLRSQAEHWQDYYFLDYKNGKLVNISKTAVPQYSTDNIYEFAQDGKTIHVFRKKYDSPTKEISADYGVSKGRKLYDLVWSNGKF